MSTSDEPARTDYSRHTSDELREAIAQAERQDPRIGDEDSDEALRAERDQRDAMREELRRRGET